MDRCGFGPCVRPLRGDLGRAGQAHGLSRGDLPRGRRRPLRLLARRGRRHRGGGGLRRQHRRGGGCRFGPRVRPIRLHVGRRGSADCPRRSSLRPLRFLGGGGRGHRGGGGVARHNPGRPRRRVGLRVRPFRNRLGSSGPAHGTRCCQRRSLRYLGGRGRRYRRGGIVSRQQSDGGRSRWVCLRVRPLRRGLDAPGQDHRAR